MPVTNGLVFLDPPYERFDDSLYNMSFAFDDFAEGTTVTIFFQQKELGFLEKLRLVQSPSITALGHDPSFQALKIESAIPINNRH